MAQKPDARRQLRRPHEDDIALSVGEKIDEATKKQSPPTRVSADTTPISTESAVERLSTAREETARRLHLIPIKEVTKRTSTGKTSIYEMVRIGSFPPPVKVRKASRWVDAEISEWIRDRIADRGGR